MHAERSFCEHFCVQMIIWIPAIFRKGSIEREHPFLTEFVLIMNSCFIQYNAPLLKHVIVAEKINLIFQVEHWFLTSSDEFHYLWGTNCFCNGTRQIFNFSVWVLKFTHTFLLSFFIVHFRQEISSVESGFLRSGKPVWIVHPCL